MAKLKDINTGSHNFLELNGMPWFPEAANHRGLAKGGIYLLSGPPGGGKTTLALQVAVDLSSRKRKVHILLLSNPLQN